MTSAAAGDAGAITVTSASAATSALDRRSVDVGIWSPSPRSRGRGHELYARRGPRWPPPSRGLRARWLRLLRRRNAERRVTRAARLAAEVLHDHLGRGGVLGAGGVAQLHRPRLKVLRRGLELRPLLPDLGFCLRLLRERALREQHRNVLGVESHRLGVDGDSLDVARLELGLGVRPA